MPVNLSIKNVPDELASRLRKRAAKNHRSLQGELMAILEQTVADTVSLTPRQVLDQVQLEAEQVVRAAMPNAAIREHLNMDDGVPAFVVIRRTWSDGCPVTFGRFHHPGCLYFLTCHFTPPGTQRSMSPDVVQLEQLEQ